MHDIILLVDAGISGNTQSNREVVHTRVIEDFSHLYQAVAEIGDWQALCSNLGVNAGKMNELRHSTETINAKKRECLLAYFDTGEANWNDVVEAVKKPPLSNNRVAKHISQKYNHKDEL